LSRRLRLRPRRQGGKHEQKHAPPNHVWIVAYRY
jgi:hypothetical protein